MVNQLCNTFPPGKEVVVKDKSGRAVYQGKTPMTVTLPACSGFFSPARYTIAVLENDKPVAVDQISASIDPWYVGNILFGGLIGILIVDPATGAMWCLTDRVIVGTQVKHEKVSERAEVWYDDPVSF